VSGFRKPSRANQDAFDKAIVEISGSVERLLGRVGALDERAEVMAANERK